MLKSGHHLSDAEIGARYEKLHGLGSIGDEFRRRVIDLAGNIKGLTVADIGCGKGELIRDIAALGPAHIFGVDIVDGELSALKSSSGIMIDRLTANLNVSIPLPRESQDVVFCTEVLEHLKNPENCLKEIHRVLRSGGRFILTVPNATAYVPFLRVGAWIPTQWLRARLLPYEHPCNTGQPIDTCFEYNEILSLVGSAGWKIERQYGYRFFRYLEVLPIVRSLYGPFIRHMERFGNAGGWQRYAYNLMMLCRKT